VEGVCVCLGRDDKEGKGQGVGDDVTDMVLVVWGIGASGW
jgi:hypothetical protein